MILTPSKQLWGVKSASAIRVEITQERINKFAEATGDEQWIHVDADRAAREFSRWLYNSPRVALALAEFRCSRDPLSE